MSVLDSVFCIFLKSIVHKTRFLAHWLCIGVHSRAFNSQVGLNHSVL